MSHNPAENLCISDPMFTPTYERIVWKNPYKGRLMISFLYTPSAEATSWDGVPADSMAVGSEKGGWFYVGLRRTGKTPTRIPNTNGTLGLRCKILFNADRAGVDGNEKDVWTDGYLLDVPDLPYVTKY